MKLINFHAETNHLQKLHDCNQKLTTDVNPLFFDNREYSLWDLKTASAKLSVSVKTLRDWVYKRQIPFKKVGKLIRFDPSEIHLWIEGRTKEYGN